MKIGKLKLSNPVILAPMAGVTDQPFRRLVREMGCGLVYSEMVSDMGLVYQNERTLEMLRIEADERPVALQIFGSDPEAMAKAARIVARVEPDTIDINMGCPAQKIVKNGEGSALMKTPELACRIMAAVVEAVDIPVTLKIRAGWSQNSLNAVEMAGLAEKAGIAAIAVHGRTREQFYSGQADWNVIKAVKESVSIPVIGNGDIRSPKDAARMLEETGCDAVMIGRGAQGNPWLFRQIVRYLEDGVLLPGPTLEERIDMVLRHLEMLTEHKGEYIAVREMRCHASWYTKGLRRAAELRLRFNQAQSKEDFAAVMHEFKA